MLLDGWKQFCSRVRARSKGWRRSHRERVRRHDLSRSPEALETRELLSTVTVSVVNGETTEGTSAPLRFRLMRTDAEGELTVNVSLGGTATIGADYRTTGLRGTTAVTFANGNQVANVKLTPLDDQVVERNESVTLQLLAGSGYELGNETSVSGVIKIDADNSEIVVDTLIDENDGNLSRNDLSLREALLLANDVPGTQVISFSPRLTEAGPATLKLTGTLPTVTGGITINGPDVDATVSPSKLTIQAADRGRLFRFITNSDRATIRGLTLAGGELTSVAGENNSEGYGGAAIYCVGNLTVARCVLTDNTARVGGAIYISEGSGLIQQSFLFDNHSTLNGGALAALNSNVAIVDSTFTKNIAGTVTNVGSGGAIFSQGGDLTVTQSTLFQNSATVAGAIQHDASGNRLLIEQSSIAANSATVTTGGIATNAKFSISNSLAYANTLNGKASDVTASNRESLFASNFVGAVTSPVVPTTGGGNLLADLRFTPLSDVVFPALVQQGGPTPTLPPTQQSALLGAGSSGYQPVDRWDSDGDGDTAELIPFDQRGIGYQRIRSRRVDMGAVEGPTTSTFVSIEAVKSTAIEQGFNETSVVNGKDTKVHTDDTLTFRVHRSTRLNDLPVKLSFGGTAALRSDFNVTDASLTDAIATLTIPDRKTSAMITLTAVADSVFEGDEDVTVRVDAAPATTTASGTTPASTTTPAYSKSLSTSAVGSLLFSDVDIVVDELTDEDDGIVGTGETTLREAIRMSNRTDSLNTISFASSLFAGGPATLTLKNGPLETTGDLLIGGPGADTLTITAEGKTGLFDLRNLDESAAGRSKVIIENLTLTGGKRSPSLAANVDGSPIPSRGGAINSDVDLGIRNCVLVGNSADVGGAIYETRGSLVMEDNFLIENTAGSAGGAIAWEHSGSGSQGDVVLSRNWLHENRSAGDGGAIYQVGGRLRVDNSTLSQNLAIGKGGALRALQTTLAPRGIVEIANSTIVENDAAFGGGISSDAFRTTVSQSTLVNNFGNGRSLAVTTQAILKNTIVLGREVQDSPFLDITGKLSVLQSVNNLFSVAGSSGGIVNGVNGNIVGKASGEALRIADIVDPVLRDNGGTLPTYLLVPNSLAVNAGSNDAIPYDSPFADPTAVPAPVQIVSDQRGGLYRRTRSGTVDIGAVEFLPYTITITPPSATVTEEGSNKLAWKFERNNSTGPLAVNVAISGTATLDQDFEVQSPSAFEPQMLVVRFPDRTNSVTIEIDPKDDQLIEPDESIIFTPVGKSMTFRALTTDKKVAESVETRGLVQSKDIEQVRVRLSDDGVLSFKDLTGGRNVLAVTKFASTPATNGTEATPDSWMITSTQADLCFDGTKSESTLKVAMSRVVSFDFDLANGNDIVDLTPVTVPAVLHMGGGNDSVIGGLGDDQIFGGDGADTLQGRGGSDTLQGEAGNDSLVGGIAADSLVGGDGNDQLDGQNGTDTLTGGTGSDIFVGGPGRDLVLEVTDVASVTLADDRIVGLGATDSANEHVIEVELFQLTGGPSANVFWARDLNAPVTLIGGDGDDQLVGSLKASLIEGGAGNDRLIGGPGNDQLNGNAGDDTLLGDAGNDVLVGGLGDDVIDGVTGQDTLNGGNGDDLMRGGEGDDFLQGQEGNDTLLGSAGNDTLNGADGADMLLGEAGNDSLNGGDGRDQVAGGGNRIAASPDDVFADVHEILETLIFDSFNDRASRPVG